MTHLTSGTAVRLSLTFLVFMMLIRPNAAIGQAFHSNEVKEDLKKTVLLSPLKAVEKGTLRALLAELSEQTGLKVEAESFLIDRTVSVSASGQSAGEILDSLAELNDWVWIENKDRHIFLSRPRYITPKNLTEVPKAMQRCLPLDIRRYMGVGAGPDDLLIKESSSFHGNIAMTLKQSPELIISQSNANRLAIASQQVEDAILKVFSQKHFRIGELYYQSWDKDLRELVFKRLTLKALQDEATPANAGIYLAALQPFELDPSKALISLGGGMDISSFVPPPPNQPGRTRIVGFGNVIPEEVEWERKNKGTFKPKNGRP